MPGYNPEFDRIMKEEFPVETPTERIDPTPYGAPVQAPKTGLTTRGKAALGISAAVIAGGSLIGYQAHSSSVAESEAKAQELRIQSQALELEKLREMNRANEVDRKATAGQDKARQASVNACIKQDKSLVGKGLGAPSYREVIDACQAQYPSSQAGGDMEAAASSEDAGTSGDGGVNGGLLLGGSVLVVALVAAVKKGTRPNPA